MNQKATALTLAVVLSTQAGLADFKDHPLAVRHDQHIETSVHPEFPSTVVPWFASGMMLKDDMYELSMRSVPDADRARGPVELTCTPSAPGPKLFARFASVDDLIVGLRPYLPDWHLDAIRRSLSAGQATGIGGHLNASVVFDRQQLQAILRRAEHLS